MFGEEETLLFEGTTRVAVYRRRHSGSYWGHDLQFQDLNKLLLSLFFTSSPVIPSHYIPILVSRKHSLVALMLHMNRDLAKLFDVILLFSALMLFRTRMIPPGLWFFFSIKQEVKSERKIMTFIFHIAIHQMFAEVV